MVETLKSYPCQKLAELIFMEELWISPDSQKLGFVAFKFDVIIANGEFLIAES